MLSAIGMALVLYGALVVTMYMNQRNMLYFATTQKFDPAQSEIKDVREITVHTEDGLALLGWYLPPAKKDMATIVRFHGNGSNVLWGMNGLKPYVEQGYGALSVEYRGFSGNPGRPEEQGFYADARAFIEWLKQNGTDEEKIILYGESVGSGPAVQMAVEYPAVQALVLQCPFSSLTEVASLHYPYVPVKWLLKDRFDNLDKISRIKTPLILAHGTIDTIVPYASGKKLFDAAPDPKTLITIEGGNHNDLVSFGMNEKILGALSE